jgi:hypothetical protein
MPRGDPWKAMELKMPRGVYDLLDVFARRRGKSRSEYIRWVLDLALEREVRMAMAGDDPNAAAARLRKEVAAITRARAAEEAARRARTGR